MTIETIFHLSRHGQTHWNIEHRIQGQLDSQLTAKGEQQALKLANLCHPLNITQILCSSLGRTTATAKICATKLQCPWKILPGIEERNFGIWQGKQTCEIQVNADYTEITSMVTDCKPEQGESAIQLLTRFKKAIIEQFKIAPNERYLIVTHGDVLRVFMNQFLHPGQTTTGYDYANGQLITITFNHMTGSFTSL